MRPGAERTAVGGSDGWGLAGLGVRGCGVMGELGGADHGGLYIGSNAIKTTELVTKAVGGVLFMDEAYTLSTGSGGAGPDFGRSPRSRKS